MGDIKESGGVMLDGCDQNILLEISKNKLKYCLQSK